MEWSSDSDLVGGEVRCDGAVLSPVTRSDGELCRQSWCARRHTGLRRAAMSLKVRGRHVAAFRAGRMYAVGKERSPSSSFSMLGLPR